MDMRVRGGWFRTQVIDPIIWYAAYLYVQLEYFCNSLDYVLRNRAKLYDANERRKLINAERSKKMDKYVEAISPGVAIPILTPPELAKLPLKHEFNPRFDVEQTKEGKYFPFGYHYGAKD